MLSVDVDADKGLVIVWVGGLHHGVVSVIDVLKCIEALDDKFEECLQIFRARRSDKDVTIAISNGGCHSDT